MEQFFSDPVWAGEGRLERLLQEFYQERNSTMYGAILGDIIGSPYEFDRGEKTKAFPLFPPHARFTDDTVMTIAVAALGAALSTRRLRRDVS